MDKVKIGIIGLGYVGLPLARLFAKKYKVVGFDENIRRIKELKSGFDRTLEIENKLLKSVLTNKTSSKKGLFCTSNLEKLKDCNYYIITVPTPVDINNKPLLTPLLKASKTIGSVLKRGDIVIYESTVYPGTTEEECIPIIEKRSGLKFNTDFYVGYSPERINPGDKEHTIEKVLKITSGSTAEIGKKIDELYKSVIIAGTHLAPSIKVAEAAKVIENSQRDINIAFVNELFKIFNLMEINTYDILEAANTKWNFLPFKPGLVGGHCIGVDPYYLAKKAQEYGYSPEIILAGRKLNDGMGNYVALELVNKMIQKNIKIKKANVLVLGITFKENCPDIRNTRVADLIDTLRKHGIKTTIYDPVANPKEVKNEYNLTLSQKLPNQKFDAIIITVAHNEFKKINFKKIKKENAVFYDLKNVLEKNNRNL